MLQLFFYILININFYISQQNNIITICGVSTFLIATVVFTLHVPVYFAPNRHNFGDIKLKFCIYTPLIIHQNWKNLA